MNYDESKKLVNALPRADLKYQIVIHFAIIGGLRRSEILGIKWADVDFENNLIRIHQSSLQPPNCGYIVGDLKNNPSRRVIYMPDTTMKLLKLYKVVALNTDNDFLLTNDRGVRKGKRLCPSTVTRWFRLFRETEGLPPGVPLHGLRHTSATILLTEGIDIKNISARLGHSNADTTLDVYSHSLPDVDKEASDSLAELLFGDSKPKDTRKRYTGKFKLDDLRKMAMKMAMY